MATPVYTAVTRDGPQNISLITIPAGTILFRGIRIPEDPLAFYTDYLGTPLPDGTLCLKPTHNVFFYAHPLVSFGVHRVGKTYDAMQVVVLVKDVNVICLMQPSALVRGSPKGFPASAPIQRCSEFKESCTDLSAQEVDALSYDNCLLPSYQRTSGTRGWMAIANMDSIEPTVKEANFEGTMGPYLKGLEKRFPGVGSLLAASTYMDATRAEKGKVPRNGFPEVVLYPYATAPSDANLYQQCTTERMAMTLLAKHAKNDNLLYLPLATITQAGVLDMVGGHFAFDRLAKGVADQTKVEKNLIEYLNKTMRYGLRVPYYGNGAVSFDKRTGFYVLPQVAAPSTAIIPMDSKDPKARKIAYDTMRKYLVTARQFDPKGTFVFSRPAVAPVFRALGMSMPKDMYEYVKGSTVTSASASATAPKPILTRGGTRRQGTRAKRTTRVISKNPLVRYANHITSLWKLHAKNKAK